MAKVSVIVPNYNHARFLPQRLDSIFQQTFQDFELLLLDDASTDNSRDILARYADDPRVKVIFNETNSGSVFRQWNRGVQAASGEYVWIAESDDFADPRLLEALVQRLDANPHVGLAYCQSWAVDERDEIIESCTDWTNDLSVSRWSTDYINNGLDECSRYLVFKNYIFNASAVLFRRRLFDQIGGADESLRLTADWMVWAKILLHSDIAYCAERLNHFRRMQSSVTLSNQKNGVCAEESYVVSKYILNHVSLPFERRERLRTLRLAMWMDTWAALSAVPWKRHRHIFSIALSIDPLAGVRILGWPVRLFLSKTRRMLIRVLKGILRRLVVRSYA